MKSLLKTWWPSLVAIGGYAVAQFTPAAIAWIHAHAGIYNAWVLFSQVLNHNLTAPKDSTN